MTSNADHVIPHATFNVEKITWPTDLKEAVAVLQRLYDEVDRGMGLHASTLEAAKAARDTLVKYGLLEREGQG